MIKSYDSSKKEGLQRKIRQRVAERGPKKKKEARKRNAGGTTGVVNRRCDNPTTLPELLKRIDEEITENTSVVKRMKLFSEMRGELERGYTIHTKIDSANEYVERVQIGSAEMEICIPTPSEALSRPESKNWFFGDTLNKELADIFAPYMEAGVREAFKSVTSLRKEIRAKRKIKRPLLKLVPGFSRVITSDLIQDINVRKLEDMVPERVYLLPYGRAMPYGGYAYLDDTDAMKIGVRAILMDKIEASNPDKPNSLVAAHEVIHAMIQQNVRHFHVEHLTHLIDLMGKNKKTFFFEFLAHPYTLETEILNVVDIYMDDKILPLYKGLGNYGWWEFEDNWEMYWKKDILAKAKRIEERLDGIRSQTIDVMKKAEAEYHSIDKYGLDTLIVLTGLECLPLWLTAVREFDEPVIGTEEERREFRRDYGKTLKDMIKDVKETYFEEAKEELANGNFESFEHTIMDAFYEAVDEHYDLTLKQRKLAWDMFMRSFIDDEGKIKYEHVNPGSVLAVIVNSAEYIMDTLDSHFINETKAEKLLDRLQLFDYLAVRLGFAQGLADIREDLLSHDDKLTEAKEIGKYDSVVLLPETDILRRYGQRVYDDGKTTYRYGKAFNNLLKRMKKKVVRMPIPDLKDEGGESVKPFKVVQYYDDEKCIFVRIFRGHEGNKRIKYDRKRCAIMFSADRSERLNTMAYSSLNEKGEDGYGQFDSIISCNEGFRTPSFDELIEPQGKSWYKQGQEIYSKRDWLR